jgi:hypothetical protein
MDIYLPFRSVKSHPLDKPWMNPDIKCAMAKRQQAWINGHILAYNFYHNQVQKLCSRARRSFYNTIVNHTHVSNPKKWWHNIKLLAGLSKSSTLSCLPYNGQLLRDQDLADHIANSCCTVADDIPPLDFSLTPVSLVPDKYIISPAQVESALSRI